MTKPLSARSTLSSRQGLRLNSSRRDSITTN